MKIQTPMKWIVFLLMIAVTNLANADLILNVSSDNGASFATEFEVQVDDSITLGVWLTQTDSTTILTDDGLVSFGFDLERTSLATGRLQNLRVNPIFDFANWDVPTTGGFEWEFADGDDVGVRGSNIFLGTFDYLAAEAGVSVFSLSDRLLGVGQGNASWVTPGFTELDEQIFGAGAAGNYQFSVTSTAVPEPSSILVLSSLVCVSTVYRRRRGLP